MRGVGVLAGRSLPEAVALGAGVAPDPSDTDPREYLRWRARIRRAVGGAASPVLRTA